LEWELGRMLVGVWEMEGRAGSVEWRMKEETRRRGGGGGGGGGGFFF